LNVRQIAHGKDRILNKFRHFLSENFQPNVKHAVDIQTESEFICKFAKARSIPYRFKSLVKLELDALTQQGIVEPIKFCEYAAPIVTVIKDSGKIRICGDYSQTINKYCKHYISPMPTIDEVLQEVGVANVFSRIDLKNAYLQIPLTERSKNFTTINTPFGLYRYNFLPFGISPAAAIFQNFISKTLAGISGLIIYLDDILVMTETESTHEQILCKTLERLQSAGIKLNVDKCVFFTDRIQFLGHIFDANGAHPSVHKAREITEVSAPLNTKQLKSFVGLVSYYAKFIPRFAEQLAPLYALLKKNVSYTWGDKQQRSFANVKEYFKGDLIIKLFNPNLPIKVQSDASKDGIGGVILQQHNDDWMPVKFASRTLNASERNYSQIEREALAVVFTCEKFKMYLLGNKFTIECDHKPLLKLLNCHKYIPDNTNARIIRWALKMSQFSYDIVFIKGSENVLSDAMSRLPLPETVPVNEPTELVLAINTLEKYTITSDVVQQETTKDKHFCKLQHYVLHGFPDKVDKELAPYVKIKDEISLLQGCLMWRNRVIIPPSLRPQVLTMLHANHPGEIANKSLARVVLWFPGIESDIQMLVRKCRPCQLNANKPNQFIRSNWSTPDRKWQRLHCDHFFFEGKIFLIMVDALTKYVECELVKSVNSQDTIETCYAIFSRHGFPEMLVSDNATSYTSNEFKDFLKINNIEQVTSPAYSSQSNGLAERYVETIKHSLSKNIEGSMKVRLSKALLQLRTVPSTVTGKIPSLALNGRIYVTARDRINPLYNSKIKTPIDLTPTKTFEIGQPVYVFNALKNPKWIEGTIKEKLGNVTYLVTVENSDKILKRHVTQMKSRYIITEAEVTGDKNVTEPRRSLRNK